MAIRKKKFPDDPNGHVLRLMKEYGADFSKARPVHFYLYFPNERDAQKAKDRLNNAEYDVEMDKSDYSGKWLCLATKILHPGYNTLTKISVSLEKLAAELNGNYDGWETMLE
jgi:hypothetical protein